jgi:uncharacterized membrane protein
LVPEEEEVNIALPGFFKQQSSQGFLVTVGALWFFWKEGAATELLWMVTILGGVFIIFEKMRSAIAKEKSPSPPPPSG